MGSEPRRTGLQHALTWLIHPVSLIALGTMILNDHVLKQHYGTWWTGKLSDVAGLIFFPAIVAIAVAVLRPRLAPRTVAAWAIAVTGVGFVWVKVADAGAATASGVLSALAGPSVVLKDTTDLLALPALALAWWVAGRATSELRGATRRAAVVIVLPMAVLGSVATSPGEDYRSDDAAIVDGIVYSYTTALYGSGSGSSSAWEALGVPYEEQEPTYLHKETLNALEPAAGEPVCLPSAPSECFRPTPARYGVDVSHDGGSTWEPEFAITDRQWDRLAGELYGASPKEENLITRSVRVAEWKGEEALIAANGADGVAVRYSDGTWERLGWISEYREVEPMPSDQPEAVSTAGQLFPACVLVCSLLAYVILGAARRDLFRPRPGRLGAFAIVVVCGLFAVNPAAGLMQLARQTAVQRGESFLFTGLPELVAAFVVVILLLLTVLPVQLTWGRNAKGRGTAVLAALGIGFGATAFTILAFATGWVWALAYREILAVGVTAVASAVVAWIRWSSAAARETNALPPPIPDEVQALIGTPPPPD